MHWPQNGYTKYFWQYDTPYLYMDLFQAWDHKIRVWPARSRPRCHCYLSLVLPCLPPLPNVFPTLPKIQTEINKIENSLNDNRVTHTKFFKKINLQLYWTFNQPFMYLHDIKSNLIRDVTLCLDLVKVILQGAFPEQRWYFFDSLTPSLFVDCFS